MSLNAGHKLGPYEILSLLGKGGMGEVYKARDTRLDRTVAIKTLLGDFNERFEREAKAISALNHPHICTLYDIGKEGDMPYLVIEFIEGATLAERIRKGAVPSDQVIRIASEMASALEAAHRKGITHRDLKPGNVMLNKGGVKLLDFGLAKITASGPAAGAALTQTSTNVLTGANIVLGTPQYMAPEQIEGAEVDHRADIFAFGCVLYEMAAGKPAFEGKSATSIMAAILERPAPPLPSEAAQFDWVIANCLAKDPDARFQSVHDVRLALERVQPAVSISAPKRSSMLPWAIAAVSLAALAAVFFWRPQAPKAVAFPALTRLTGDLGVSTQPAISTDGKLLVYSSDRDGQKNLDLYVQQIGGGSPVRITNTGDDATEAAFSPDGASIAFYSSKGEGGIYIMPALGGEPRLLARGGHQPQYSPDGTTIAYWTGSVTSGDPFAEGSAKSFLIPSAGGTPRQIVADFSVARSPIWSPDGSRLMFQGMIAGATEKKDRIDAWIAPLNGGVPEQSGLSKTLGNGNMGSVYAWTVEGLLVGSGGLPNIYRFPVSAAGKVAGPGWQLTNGTEVAKFASASHNGRLAFSSGTQQSNIWGLPINGNTGKPSGTAYRITEEIATIVGFCLFADANNLVYASTRNGPMQIWQRDLGSGKTKVVAASAGRLLYPVCLPSGRIGYRQSLKITEGIILNPASGEVYTASNTSYLLDSDPKEEFATMRAVAGDLAAVDVLDIRANRTAPLLRAQKWNLYQARISPDGHWVVFLAIAGPTEGCLYVARFRGMQQLQQSEWLPIVKGKVDKPRFSPDGKLIYFTLDGEGSRSIQAVRFNSEAGKPAGDPFLVYDFRGPRVSMVPVNSGPLDLVIARDKLVTLVAESTSNIWIADLMGK